MNLKKGLELLGDVVVYQKYANYLPEEERRESFEEIVARYIGMMLKKFPQYTEELEEAREMMLQRRVLPSMRGLQFGGEAIEKKNSKLYNCAYLPMVDVQSFAETMYLLLCGNGVGYSVQSHHVDRLPVVKAPEGVMNYEIPDSIEGWANSIRVLCEAYFLAQPYPYFNFTHIRPKGTLIKSSGSRAPGPEPLKLALSKIESIFEGAIGRKLKPIEVHDLVCHLADAVLSGGVRRSAMISIFDNDDHEMLTCKSGEWWNDNLQRSRANNTCVHERCAITKESFLESWCVVRDSGSGEPGQYLTNNKEIGFNPCNEASLRACSYCNLTTIDASKCGSLEEFTRMAEIAAFLGTLQATFTDLGYLRDQWRQTTEEDALLGVSVTGIASGNLDNFDLTPAAEAVLAVNERYAKELGINTAARTTLIKPEGTSSCVLGTSSGIHDWHAPFYIRRVRMEKDTAVASYLKNKLPELIEDDVFDESQYVVSFPCLAPEGAHVRGESPIELLERIKRWNIEWVYPGHRRGDNTHNISATIPIRDNEWDEVGEWMYENRDYYNGLSVLPYNGGTYQQAPFEEITEEEFMRLIKLIPDDIDLTEVVEKDNFTNLGGSVACGGGACEITSL